MDRNKQTAREGKQTWRRGRVAGKGGMRKRGKEKEGEKRVREKE